MLITSENGKPTMLTVGRSLALLPLGAIVGAVVGFLKERKSKRSPARWLLRLAPLALLPLLSLDDAIVLSVAFVAGRVLGESLVGVGLTGGIATGKSSVSRAFREAGAVIVDADVIAREVVLPGRGAHAEIVKHFGEEVLNEDRTLNRAKLGAIIFSDPAQRKRLNSATHKYILWEMFKQLVYHRLVRRQRLVVFDAPLLFETHLLEHFTYPTVVVSCSEQHELQRLMQRDGIAQEDAEKRIASQMKLHEKVKKADLVIENDGSIDELMLSARHTLETAARLVGARRELVPRPAADYGTSST